MNILELKQKVEALKKGIMPEVQNIIESHSEHYLRLLKDQLYNGKTGNSTPIRPSYTEDVGPGKFFRTLAQARGWAIWKQKITPNSERGFWTPNLFINGYFYDSLQLTIRQAPATMSLYVESTANFAKDIFDKYGIPTFMLQRENQIYFSEVWIAPPLKRYIIKMLQ